jgi:HD superfamily phosphohydrolase
MKFMKEIFSYRTDKEREKLMDELDDPVVIPLIQTIIEYDGSLYQELDKLNIVARLNGIKQLGLADTCCDSVGASSTRHDHSLICAVKCDEIAQTHNLDRNLAVAAAMLHDVATPPLSDSVADGLGISDEKQFEHVLSKCPNLDALLEKYSISKNEIIDVVTGKSKNPIGQLINSKDSIDVDRWSYVNADAMKLDMLPKIWDGRYVADPFKNVTICDRKVVFTDFESVSQLLEARTQMFEKVYKNSELMAKEAFLEHISKSLLEKGIITVGPLLEMVDYQFEALIQKHGNQIGVDLFRYETFDSHGTADTSENNVINFLKQNTNRPFAVKKPKSVNPATGTPVMIESKVDTYRNWEPWRARFLEQRMSALSHTTVYGYKNDQELGGAVYKAQKRFGVPKEKPFFFSE